MPQQRSTADLVLHPVRLRVIQSLLGSRELTTAQIAHELHDVSTATLYRQIATLADAGVLEVVDERRVRGAVERTYRLRVDAAQVTVEDLASMSADDHKQAFISFVAGLIAGFDAYIDQGDIDFVRDGVSYRSTALWLTDDELEDLLAKTREVTVPFAAHGPGAGRVRRLLGSVLIPGPEPDGSHT